MLSYTTHVMDHTRYTTYAEQELRIMPENLSTHLICSGVRVTRSLELKISVGLWALAVHQSVKTQMLLSTCFSFMVNMLLSPLTRPLNNIVFVFKSHYIECLIKELGIDNSLGNPTYTPTTRTKEEILDNHRSFLWNFNQRWRTGSTITLLVSYITQVSFQTALYCLVWQMLHKTSFQIIYMYSIGGQNRAAELLWQSRVVWIRCRFWRTLKMC